MDYIATFKAMFENREFRTFSQFQQCLQRYMDEVTVLCRPTRQLQPQSPVIVHTSPVIVRSKSRTPRTTDVDLDRSGNSVSLAHGPKKAQTSITCSDYPLDTMEGNAMNDITMKTSSETRLQSS
ncbi:hypothetical protein EG68_04737 [Paragonimus skrjabini miyazakii]|uniref:Uncharacterized protein n=1 Tax=Paragonimus skrjabini miyazakii TaxID=59628 RepID=A0A8S9YQJ1_9TREM|nr:hypothetical protein EG68_04737 [Paragonimus skrjabini miyazakii]